MGGGGGGGVAAMVIKFKFQIILSMATSLLIIALIYTAPSLIAYFSPLLVSTALFLIVVVIFGHTSPLSSDPTLKKAGEGLLDYVGSGSEEFESYKSRPEPEQWRHPHLGDNHVSE